MPWSHNESEFFLFLSNIAQHILKLIRFWEWRIFSKRFEIVFFFLEDNKETKNIFHICYSYWQYVMIITLVFQNATTYTENERKKSLIIIVLSDIIHFWQRTITLSENIWIFGEKKVIISMKQWKW